MDFIGPLVKALGIKLTPAQIAELTAILPTIPAKVAESVKVINEAVGMIEEQNAKIDAILEHLGVKYDAGNTGSNSQRQSES